jgi:hypothetical protein
VEKAKAILIAVIAVIVIGGLLLFASPAPQIEKGIGPLQPVFIGLSALVGVILLVIFIKNIRAIIRSAAAGLASVITVIVTGGLDAKLGISDAGMAKFRTFILRSAALGCLALVAIVVYFLTDEVNLFFIAWLFFILQLGLLVFPLIFARIMILTLCQ